MLQHLMESYVQSIRLDVMWGRTYTRARDARRAEARAFKEGASSSTTKEGPSKESG